MSVEVLGFSAEWCGPCKQLRPILDDLDEEYDAVEFSHIDIEEQTELVNEYGVQAVPTLVILANDEVQAQLTGFQQKETIEENWLPSSDDYCEYGLKYLYWSGFRLFD